ncbi:MAG TPA: glycosyltransferase [Candidatus Nitrosocosmicus sp.]|nr:glycosyltransferase [Candidatus Nitrosocosmicus sp.]
MGITLSDQGLTESQIKAAELMGISYEEMFNRMLKMQYRQDVKVSIIIPVYNGEKYIEECIKSALSQTFESVEVIVVNDGSTDSTHDILKYVNNITYLIKPNGGTASALNLGIKNSNGNWIHWLSADDVLYPTAVEDMMNEISVTPNNQNYIYYSNYDIIDENSVRIGEFIEPLTRNFCSKEERFKELLGNYYGNGSSTMIHKSVFEKVKYDESLAHSEDYDFMLNVMKNGFDMKLIPIKTLKYRRHKDQLTNTVGGSLSEFIRSRYR